MAKLQQVTMPGRSVWLDGLRSARLVHGDLQALVEAGVAGVTSNPSVFEKALAGSSDYDDALGELVAAEHSVVRICGALATEDIRQAADILRPVYDETGGVDRYTSLEAGH